jgi:CRISPR-associated protein Csm3
MNKIPLTFQGKVAVSAEMIALTGLRVGAASSGLDIGGVDQPVLRDPITDQPYVPGSSLKGKLRSLLTKAHGLPLQQLVQRPVEVRIHWCEEEADYRKCPVCPTFGQFPSGPRGRRFDFITPTRLIVRDARLLPEVQVFEESAATSRKSWKDVDTDLPYSEVKVEVALDVVTAGSNPRQMERVPAGAIFDTEFLFSVYRPDDTVILADMEKNRLRQVFAAARLLEDDYLGSSGTRGYGKVKFHRIKVRWRPLRYYQDPAKTPEESLWEGDDLSTLLTQFDQAIAARVWGS